MSVIFVLFSTEEFKRAVLISTGGVLGDHIVNTVFQLFDIDGMLICYISETHLFGIFILIKSPVFQVTED